MTLKHLETEEGQDETEVVYAKYVLGADGAHSWVRKSLGFSMDGEQTGKLRLIFCETGFRFHTPFYVDYVWGVVDMVPKMDFPDIRNRCAIHSPTGSCMIIPREGDVVRLYLQITDEEAKEVKNVQGRVDLTKWTPQRLMEVAKRSLTPYNIEFPNEVQWWTLYISKFQIFMSNAFALLMRDRTVQSVRELRRTSRRESVFSSLVMHATRTHRRLARV